MFDLKTMSPPALVPPTSTTSRGAAQATTATVAATVHETWWSSLTPGQGTAIGGGFTFAAAVVGVLLGWWLLSGKVKDLQGALDKSDQLLRGHSENVDRVLRDVGEKLSELEAQIGTATESLGQLRGDVGDLQSTALPEPEVANVAAVNTREAVRDAWTAIRDKLEEIAAQTPDGRTRARYGRIDRRSYIDLIAALSVDGRLGDLAESYRQASAIWAKYRNGRRAVTPADEAAIAACRRAILGNP